MKKIILGLLAVGVMLTTLNASESGDLVVSGTVKEYTHIEFDGVVSSPYDGIHLSVSALDFGAKTESEIGESILGTKTVVVSTNHDKAISITSTTAQLIDSSGSTTIPLVLKWVDKNEDYATDAVVVTNGDTTNTVEIYSGGASDSVEIGTLYIEGGELALTELKSGAISGTTTITATIN
jgi:hypothetical protein